jgi:hypothetical protein
VPSDLKRSASWKCVATLQAVCVTCTHDDEVLGKQPPCFSALHTHCVSAAKRLPCTPHTLCKRGKETNQQLVLQPLCFLPCSALADVSWRCSLQVTRTGLAVGETHWPCDKSRRACMRFGYGRWMSDCLCVVGGRRRRVRLCVEGGIVHFLMPSMHCNVPARESARAVLCF